MPRLDLKTCRECGRHASECGQLSHTRLCLDCGLKLQEAGIVQQVNHAGPIFQHWRRRIAASVGAVMADERGGSL